jgi:hypothetical protein
VVTIFSHLSHLVCILAPIHRRGRHVYLAAPEARRPGLPQMQVGEPDTKMKIEDLYG